MICELCKEEIKFPYDTATVINSEGSHYYHYTTEHHPSFTNCFVDYLKITDKDWLLGEVICDQLVFVDDHGE